MAEETPEEAERNVEMWKIKKLIKGLEAARGCVCTVGIIRVNIAIVISPWLYFFIRFTTCLLTPRLMHHARSNGTSMISLIMPPKSQISQFAGMLATEFGTASNIKSRVNR